MAFAAPSYLRLNWSFFAYRRLASVLREFRPDFIHIATEGPLGWMARRLCLYQNLPFTTAYHTRFPEYLAARALRILAGVVRRAIYMALHRFHAPSNAVMVATMSISAEI